MHWESIVEKRKNAENILLRNGIPKIFYFMKSPRKKIIATMNDTNPTQNLMNCGDLETNNEKSLCLSNTA
jgi:hypothetical protein